MGQKSDTSQKKKKGIRMANKWMNNKCSRLLVKIKM